MRNILFALCLLLISGSAYAQFDDTPPFGGNLNSTSGYQLNGKTVTNLSVGYAGQQGLFQGPGAGSYFLSHNVNISFGAVGAGIFSLASMQNGDAEPACGGAYSCQYAITGFGITGWGEHVIGYDNCSYCTAFGIDVMRDTIGNTDSTGSGAQSQLDGVGSSNTTSGAFALRANAGSISIAGNSTAGDAYTVSFSSTNGSVLGLPASVSYTTVGVEPPPTLATHLTNLINGLPSIYTPGGGPSPGNGVQLAAYNTGSSGTTIPVIRLHFPGSATQGWAITPAVSCVGTCTATLTVNPAFSGQHIIANGAFALDGAQLQAASNIIANGDFSLSNYGLISPTNIIAEGVSSLQNLIGSPSGVICAGTSCGSSATSALNSVIFGQSQITNATGITDCVIVSGIPLSAMTNCNMNTIINGSNDITSGLGNVELGWGSTVPSATTNWQLSIMDAIYGTNCNKGGGGSSNCQIGIGQSAPGAKLDILGFDTGATLALRVQNSTPSVVLSVTDAGALTVPALSTVGTIAGSLCATSGGLILYESGATGCTISLENLKHGIAPISQDIARHDIMALEPRQFAMNEPTNSPLRYGFTAHQVHGVNPVLSTFDGKGDLQAYDPNGILAETVAVVQHQQAEIEGKATIPTSEARAIHDQQIEIYLLAAWCALLTGWLLFVTVRRQAVI